MIATVSPSASLPSITSRADLPNRGAGDSRGGWFRSIAAIAILGSLAPAAGGAPLLPDLFSWARDAANPLQSYMYDGYIDTESVPNQVQYRFNVAIPNIGDGPFEVREETDESLTQQVFQRIYDSEGGVAAHLIGTFANAQPEFGHLYLQGLAQYNLREVEAGNGVGPIIISYDKTSFGIVDSVPYDTTLPGAPATRVYANVSADLLGVSIGWADLYSRTLRGQRIDVTGLPSGQYWLEVVIDPYNRIQESDETNNTTRILVDLVVPPPQIVPGDYNADEIVDAADYTVWRDSLGQSIDFGHGADGNANGIIDFADYEVWKENFGLTPADFGAGATTPGAGVPEPGSALLAAICLAAATLLARRSTRSAERPT